MGQDCKYCGAYISGGETVCPACGKRVKAEKGGAYSYGTAYAAPEKEKKTEAKAENHAYTYKQEYEKRYGGSERAGAERNEKKAADDGGRALSYLSYFGPLFLVPYLMKRDSKFAVYHANQGLLLFIANMILGLLDRIVPFIGGLIEIAGTIFVLVCFIKGLVNVSKGVMEPLPVIGDIVLLK